MSPTTLILLSKTKQLIVDFADTNSIELPKLQLPSKNDRICRYVNTCGFYRNHIVTVAPELCARPNPMYSWPSYISDRTIYGVIPHEFGHYIDDLKSKKSLYSSHVYSKSREKAITSYAPNTQEWFAEMFRLFLTNPDLLKLIRPKTYEILSDDFQVVESRKFKSVLKEFDAPERVYVRLERFSQRKCV